MKFLYYLILVLSLGTIGCAVQTNQGMTMGQLNNAVGLSGNGSLVLVNRVGDYEIYQSSAVLNWKSQIAQGNQIAKSILTPEKNVYYVLKGGVLQQEVVGDANLNSFTAKEQPPTKPSAQQNLNNRPQQSAKDRPAAPVAQGPQKPTDIIIINKDNAAAVGSCHGAFQMAHNSGYSWAELGGYLEQTNRLSSMHSGNLNYSAGLQNGLNQMRDASPQLQAQTVQYCVKLLRL